MDYPARLRILKDLETTIRIPDSSPLTSEVPRTIFQRGGPASGRPGRSIPMRIKDILDHR